MRVLLDECVPRPLKRELTEHAVSTVLDMGWKGVENGDLLARIQTAGFEAFITVDQNLSYQQNLRAAGIRVVVLVARSNKLRDLLPLLPSLRRVLETLQAGEVIKVSL
jgi:hypothetical protein